jgi:hypothetical protein
MPRFRISQGQYIQNDPATNKERTYFQGDIVECNIDLDKLFGYDKFERMVDTGRSPISVEEAARRGFDPATSNTGQEQQKQEPQRQEQQKQEPQKQEPRTMHSASDVSSKPASQSQPQGQSHTEQSQAKQPLANPRNATEAEYFKNLSKMNVNQLREHAESEEIDLKGANTRDDILRAIRESTTTNL